VLADYRPKKQGLYKTIMYYFGIKEHIACGPSEAKPPTKTVKV
jgi:hypothetical protein